MTDVFISYKRRMRPRVEVLAARLEALGVDVWFDAELESGSTFSAVISEKVRTSKSVLVCWSNDAFPHGGDKHGWVLGEATIGRERGVLVAAFLEKTDLDPPWNMVHADDLTQFGTGRGTDASWHNVLLAIGRHLGRPGLADYDRARRSGSQQALLEWAEKYPGDPQAQLVSPPDTRDQAALTEALELIERRSINRKGGMGAIVRSLVLFGVVAVVAAVATLSWVWQQGYLGEMVARTVPASSSPASDSATRSEPDRSVASTISATSQSPTGSSAVADPSSSASSERTTDGIAAEVSGDAGSTRSLLLEASDNGETGAVPFSGTAEWSKGTDEYGQPTLVGKASIPARNLTVALLIRKNSEQSLPASHLMEINFATSASFIGGSIAGLPGVLLKNEELVQGVPLIGASARVVGNSFLFAMSATPADERANTGLLTTRKWMDLALIYASGKRAIVTLQKDAKAQALFAEVFALWSGDLDAAAYVHLSSWPSVEQAYVSLEALNTKYGSFFDGHQLAVQTADLGEKGTWYRVRLLVPSLTQAQSICVSLKANGGDCIVTGS